MRPQVKLALTVGLLCLTVLAAIVGVAGALWAALDTNERATAGALLAPRLPLVFLLLAIASGAVAFIVAPFVRAYLAGPAKLAEQARIVLNANRAYRVAETETAELDALARVLNELADQRDALHVDVERQIRESQAKLEEEKNRLAALISELAQGIVACNLDGQILLYNSRARLQFTALAQRSAAGSALIGLGRSIFSVIERPVIDHALDNIRRRLECGSQRATANFVTATRTGQLIRVQMAPVLATVADPVPVARDGAQGSVSGYVLLLENITRSFEAESRRDQALQTLTEGSRASVANIRAAVEALAGYPDMDAAQRERFIGVITEEVQGLSEQLEYNAAQHADALKARWELEEMRGADLVAAAQTTIENRLGVAVHVEHIAPSLWVKADSFILIRALAWIAARVHEEFAVAELKLQLTPAERLAQLDLVWTGTAAQIEALQAWEHQPMKFGAESSVLTLHDVAERHGGEAWFARDDDRALTYCRLLLPIAEPEHEALQRAEAARPEYYDFALFDRAGAAHALDQRLLAELTYTVFDTETTGLSPTDGDEIIQIGAVRIVNLRLLRNETFEQLVDPRRGLDRASTRIHGISEDMLRGQPTIDEVLPAFHAFCEDTVLVGHNAAFDMRFLQLKEQSTGVRFEQPLLDTLLLSEVMQPAQETHRHKLEAIAERLGVRVGARHNALGDAIITAEVFLRMIGLLADAGIRTLGEARDAAAKTHYAKVQY